MRMNAIILGNKKQNYGDKLTLKNIEPKNPALAPEIATAPQENEKSRPRQNSLFNPVNVGATTEQLRQTEVLNQKPIDQILLNKHVKIRGEDVLIKSVI